MTDLIDRLAMAICEELGIDPHEVVSCGIEATMTRTERLAHGSFYGSVSYQVPRWQTYREMAEMQLVMTRAMRHIEKDAEND